MASHGGVFAVRLLSKDLLDTGPFHFRYLAGIAFAGSNRRVDENADNGILTDYYVSSLDFSKADLVVLSACYTALESVKRGDGFLGLQRAFQIAGAKSVVAILGSDVPDRETSVLMAKFYENLWKKKMSKIEALRQAQLAMLQEGVKNLDLGTCGIVKSLDKSKHLLPLY